MRRLNHYVGVRFFLKECPRYNIKISDGKTLVVEHWGMWSTFS